MCQDYTNLNKACPKDSFPLPRIDQLVDATAGHELLSFMDAYSGYNQIFMHPADQEHTAFINDRGLYCYNVMPFGLKNAGATYQRLFFYVLKCSCVFMQIYRHLIHIMQQNFNLPCFTRWWKRPEIAPPSKKLAGNRL
ncbi:unnamed protein product [Prunus brigantina]